MPDTEITSIDFISGKLIENSQYNRYVGPCMEKDGAPQAVRFLGYISPRQ